jgi:hypothetical protein
VERNLPERRPTIRDVKTAVTDEAIPIRPRSKYEAFRVRANTGINGPALLCVRATRKAEMFSRRSTDLESAFTVESETRETFKT